MPEVDWPVPPPPPNRPNWFIRHKFLTTIAAIVIAGAAVGQAGSDTDSEALTAPADTRTPNGTSPTETSEATPELPRETQRPEEKPDDPTEDTPEPAITERPSSSAPLKPQRLRERTYLVTRVVDGDTIDLGNGETVRVVGIDTPEVGKCGYEQATATMERLVLGKRVRLGISDEDRDRYGRLLRYVDVGQRDAGLALIKAGLAIARYDSRDGYGYHPRETRYVAADKAAPNTGCATQPAPLIQQPPAGPGAGCEAGYSPCVPPYPPDLDCADVDGPIQVTGTDPHRLDADGDGVACES